MKIKKIEQNGRYLYVYCKKSFFMNYGDYYTYFINNFKDDINMTCFEPYPDVTGKYIIFQFVLRNLRDTIVYCDNILNDIKEKENNNETN